MSISKEQAVKDLQISDNLFVAYSQATRQPYVVCAEDTYNDQVWIFSREEEIRDFGKKKLEEDKTLLIGMKYEKKDFPKLYGTLYAVGVNSIVWNKGDEQIEIELSDVAKQRDLSSIEAAKRPLMNPTLQLCGM
ncbi:MAG: SseB family protein, partial [Blautia sp.]|nr:SseB family protein [Blautia sp.]